MPRRRARLGPEDVKDRLHGPVNSIATPFRKDGALDERGFRNIVETGIVGGSGVALLTYGDSQFDTLSQAEVVTITRWLVSQSRGRALTVAAGNRTWTGNMVELAKTFRDIGADVLMALPSEHQANSPDIADYYRAIAKVMPVMLVGQIPFKLLDDLRGEENICCIKEDFTMEAAAALMARYGQERWKFMTGGCLWRHYTQWALGCEAFMDLYTGFRPQISRRYWDAIRTNDIPTVSKVLVETHLPFFALDGEFAGGLHAVWHAALELHGIAPRYLRKPKRSLTDADIARLRPLLRKLDLLD